MTDDEKNEKTVQFDWIRLISTQGLAVVLVVGGAFAIWEERAHTRKQDERRFLHDMEIDQSRLDTEKQRLIIEQKRAQDFSALAAAITSSSQTDAMLKAAIDQARESRQKQESLLIETLKADAQTRRELKDAMVEALTRPRQINDSRSFEFPSRGRPIIPPDRSDDK